MQLKNKRNICHNIAKFIDLFIGVVLPIIHHSFRLKSLEVSSFASTGFDDNLA